MPVADTFAHLVKLPTNHLSRSLTCNNSETLPCCVYDRSTDPAPYRASLLARLQNSMSTVWFILSLASPIAFHVLITVLTRSCQYRPPARAGNRDTSHQTQSLRLASAKLLRRLDRNEGQSHIIWIGLTITAVKLTNECCSIDIVASVRE